MSGKIIKGIGSVLSGKIFLLLIGLLTTPIIVRILGSESYGEYAFILSILSVTTVFTRVGISAGIRKYIVERRSDHWEERVFTFYFWLGLALAVLSAATIVVITWLGVIDWIVGSGYRTYFYLLAGILVAEQFIYVFRYTLMGLHQEHISEPITVGKRITFAVVGISLAYIGYDVEGLLIGTIVAALLTSLITLWLLSHHLSLRRVFRPLPSDFPYRDLVGFNVLNTVFIFLTISLYNVDILLLEPLAGSQETGYYKSALVIAEFLWFAPMAIQMVFIHSISEMWSQDDYEKVNRTAQRATRYTLSFTVLLVLGLAVLADTFVPLYFGSEFSEAVLPLLVLLPGALCFAVARPIFAIGQAKGALRILIIATGSAAVLNLILNLVLIPRYGMTGAAIATSIGYGSMVIMHTWSATKIGFNPIGDLRVGRITITAVFTFVPIYLLNAYIESSLLALMIVPPVGFLIYSFVSLKVGVFDSSEVKSFFAATPFEPYLPSSLTD